MAIPTLEYWRGRPAEVMGALGLASGILSATVGFTSKVEWLSPVSAVFFLAPDMLPIGFFFAAVVAIGVAAWTRRLWAVPVLLITTIYAWSAAIHTMIRIQRSTGDDAFLILACLAAGAVGAGLTHLGCALVAPELRRPSRIAWTIGVGAVAGLLYFAGQHKVIDERLLFVGWQPAVAFCIGRGLAGRRPQMQGS